jgi:hypothetical protein
VNIKKPNFGGYQRSAANLGYSCKFFGGLGPLEIENAQTVHKPKLKFLYIEDVGHYIFEVIPIESSFNGVYVDFSTF